MYKIKVKDDLLPIYGEILKCMIILNPVLRRKQFGKDITQQEVLDLGHQIIKTVIVKGSRKVAKTRTLIRLMNLLMIVDPRASWVSILEFKKDQKNSLMDEFWKDLERLNEKWPGIIEQYERYDSMDNMHIVRHNGAWDQVIRFKSFDETGGGTFTLPNTQTYWAGYFLDEAIKRDAKHNTEFLATEKLQDFLIQLEQTMERSQNDIRKFHNHQVWGVLKFIATNPNQGNDPILRDFNKYLPDNLKEICLIPFKKAINPEKQELYITAAVHANKWLDKISLDSFDNNILNWQDYLTDKFSMNNYGSGTILADIWYKVEEKQARWDNMSEKELTDWVQQCQIIGIGIDVGGPNAKTAYEIMAWHPFDNILTSIGEYCYNPKTAKIKLTPSLKAKEMLNSLINFEVKYTNFKFNNTLPINMNFDASNWDFMDMLNQVRINWISEMSRQGLITTTSWTPPLSSLHPRLHHEKWDTDWDPYIRALEWEAGIGAGIIVPIRRLTPELYYELPLMKVNNTKRVDGNDDCINGSEYGAYKIMKELWKRDQKVDKTEIIAMVRNMLVI